MSKTDNEAVSIVNVELELSWYRLGHQFAELNSQDQYQFFVGILDNVKHWEGPVASLMQMEAITHEFTEHNPMLKPELAKFLDDLSERLKA